MFIETSGPVLFLGKRRGRLAGDSWSRLCLCFTLKLPADGFGISTFASSFCKGQSLLVCFEFTVSVGVVVVDLVI